MIRNRRLALLLVTAAVGLAQLPDTDVAPGIEYPECGLFLVPTDLTTDVRPTRPTLSGPVSYRVKTNVRVHYTTSGSDATTWQYAESTAVYAETCWARLSRLGWHMPPPDQNMGGDNRFDIYLRSTGNIGAYGVSWPDSAYTSPYPDGFSTWVEVTKDSLPHPFPRYQRLRALVTHEFHHSCQMRYSRWEQPLWWYYENCSVWIEDIVFPGDGTLYWRNNNPSYYTQNPLTRTYYPVNSTTSTYEYPGGLWPKFLAEYYNANAPMYVWRLSGSHAGSHILLDTDSMLRVNYQGSLHNALGHYAIWRYFTGTRDDNLHYWGAERCTTALLLRTHSTYPASGNEGAWDPYGPGGMGLIQFTTSGSQDLTISFNGQNGYDWRAYVLARRGSTTYEQRIVLNSSGDGSITIPAWMVTTAVLIPVVVHWSDASSNTPALTFSYTANVADGYTAVADVKAGDLLLGRIVPNPVRRSASVRYAVPPGEHGVLTIRDAAGRSVREFVVADRGELAWDRTDASGRLAPAGVYFCELAAGTRSVRNKLALR